MNNQIRVYTSQPSTMLGRAEAARASYMGLCSWALQGMAQARAITVPFSAHPIAVQEAITDTVSIMAARALAAALGRLEVRETCGRIVLVAVEEHRIQRDPVIPLTLLNLGQQYNRAFAEYVQHLTQYMQAVADNRRGWWNKACKLCDKAICALEERAHTLTVEELSYLVTKLQVPLAWPQGREAMQNPSW